MLRGGSGTKLAYLGMLALLLTMPFGIRSAQGQFFQSQVTVGSVGNKPGVEVYVEPKDPSTADTIFYKLRITGTPDDKVIKDEGKSIRLRLPQGVRLQSAQTITEGNSTVRMGGKVFRRVRILRTFYLEAENPGTYRIPGFSIDLAGSSFPVKEQSFTVAKASAVAKTQNRSEPYFAELKSPKLGREKDSVYVGEQIPLRMQFWSKLPIRGIDMDMPSVPGFSLEEHGGKVKVQRKKLKDAEYYLVEKNYVWIPQKEGVFKIPRLSIVAEVQDASRQMPQRSRGFGWDLFGDILGQVSRTRRIKAEVPASILRVRALPTPTPANFSGLVGSVSLALSAQPPRQLPAGETSDIKILLRGDAYSQGVEDLKVTWPKGLEVYDSPGQDASYFDREKGWVLEQDFDFSVGSEWGGSYRLGSASVLYFDPVQKKYRQASVDLGQLQIEGGAQNKKALAKKQKAEAIGSDLVASPGSSILSEASFAEILSALKFWRLVTLTVIAALVLGGFLMYLWCFYSLWKSRKTKTLSPQKRWLKATQAFNSKVDRLLGSEVENIQKLEKAFQFFKTFVAEGTADAAIVAATSGELAKKLETHLGRRIEPEALDECAGLFDQCVTEVYGEPEKGSEKYQSLVNKLKAAAKQIQKAALAPLACVCLLFFLGVLNGPQVNAAPAASETALKQKTQIIALGPVASSFAAARDYQKTLDASLQVEDSAASGMILIYALVFVAAVLGILVPLLWKRRIFPVWLLMCSFFVWCIFVWLALSEFAYQSKAVVLQKHTAGFAQPGLSSKHTAAVTSMKPGEVVVLEKYSAEWVYIYNQNRARRLWIEALDLAPSDPSLEAK